MDIIELGIKADARDVDKASGSLDKLSNTSKKAETVTERLNRQTAQAAERFRAASVTIAKYGAAVSSAMVAATAAMVRSGLQSVDSLAKTADKLGVTTEALASLRHAANQTGVSTQTLDMALQRMTRRVAEAAQGTGEAQGALKELGLSANELSQMRPDDMLKRVADAMGGVENQSDKLRLSMKLFDSEGVALVNTLKGGSAALGDFEREAQAMGIAISRIDASKVEAANDAMDRVSKTMTGFSQNLAVKFAPLIEEVSNRIFGMGVDAGGAANAAGKAFAFMVKGIGLIGDAVQGLQFGWHSLKFVLQRVALGIVDTFDGVGSKLTGLWNKLPFVEEREYKSALSGFRSTMEYEMAQSAKAMEELAMGGMFSKRFQSLVDELERGFEATAAASAQGAITINSGLEEVVVTAKRVEGSLTDITGRAEPMATAYTRGIERMRDGFGDFFKDLIVNGKASFSGLLDMFKGMIAEMIATAAANRILVGVGLGAGSGSALAGGLSAITGGGGIGGIVSNIGSMIGGSVSGMYGAIGDALGSAGFLNASSLAQEAVGKFSGIGGAAMGIGSTLAGGFLGNKVFGSSKHGNMLSGIGGIAGGLFGPLGAGVGSFLGSGLGSLLGGTQRADKTGQVINFATGQTSRGDSRGNDMDEAAQGISQQLMAAAQAIGGSTAQFEVRAHGKRGLGIVTGKGRADNYGDDFDAFFADAFGRIVDGATHLDSSLQNLMRAFDGTSEETLAYSQSIIALHNAIQENPVAAAARDFADAAGNTLYNAYIRQRDAVRELLASYDGSAQMTQQLSIAMTNSQQAAYQLALGLNNIKAEMTNMFADSAKMIRQSVMSEEELFQVRKQERDDLRRSIGTINDPDQLQRTLQEINQLNNMMFQSLQDPSAERAEVFARYAEETAAAGERRADRLLESISNNQQQQMDAIGTMMQNSAERQQRAANDFGAAVERFGRLINNMSEIVA